jgi:hypothetical protein
MVVPVETFSLPVVAAEVVILEAAVVVAVAVAIQDLDMAPVAPVAVEIGVVLITIT